MAEQPLKIAVSEFPADSICCDAPQLQLRHCHCGDVWASCMACGDYYAFRGRRYWWPYHMGKDPTPRLCVGCGKSIPKKHEHTRVVTKMSQLPKRFPRQLIAPPDRPRPAFKRPVVKFVDMKRDDIPPRITTLYQSRSGRALYDGVRTFTKTKRGYKYNHLYRENGHSYIAWISGPHRDGLDSLYPEVVEVDESIRAYYWTEIRGLPERVGEARFRSPGLYTKRSRGKKDGPAKPN